MLGSRDRPVESAGQSAKRLLMEGNGVGFITATATPPDAQKWTVQLAAFFAIAASGFRRYATYRQATVAAAATNTVFGFLKASVLLAVAGAASGAAGTVAGYRGAQLVTFVWVGQGMIGVVAFWGWTDLADRIRTGEVVADLLRPIPPVVSYLATDLGRAAHAMLARFALPVVVGVVAFDLYAPRRLGTYLLFAVSVVLAVVTSFGCRYVVNATAFWLLDIRGVQLTWLLVSGVLSGLYFPLRFLPEGVATGLWLFTPFPSLLQTPLDVLVERDPPAVSAALVGLQAAWAAAMLGVAHLVQRRAERRLVIQGG